MDLTLVVPCYREATHIDRSFRDLFAVMNRSWCDYEVVFIDDCSPDDTVAHLQRLVATEPRARLVRNERNLGRGATVARGIVESRATVVGFIDIDLSTPPVYIPFLTALIADDLADVATCHRVYKIEGRVFHRVVVRYVLSYGYRYLSRLTLGHSLADTETGCKFFRREAILPILDRVEDQRWFWDTEIMVQASLAGLRIHEESSIFIRRPEKPSTVKLAQDVWSYVRNLARFRRRVRSQLRSRTRR